MEYDVLIYVANWPDKRIYAWRQFTYCPRYRKPGVCYGVNRIGKDGKEIEYSGYSAVLNPMGEPMNKYTSLMQNQ
jgi:omega-amidase